MIVICDIDGTIADISHRVHYLEKSPKDWDSFYDACDKDSHYPAIMALLHMISNGKTEIWYVSGRRESTREKTERWLREKKFPYGYVYLRQDGDKRPDTIIKKEILDKYIDRKEVLFVLEDRSSVVKMWRDEGLICLQVKEGDY